MLQRVLVRGTIVPCNLRFAFGDFQVDPKLVKLLVRRRQRGRELFRGSCGACHQLFGTGGEIGPHLTGGYTDLEYLLQNIIDPNAVIGLDYQLVYITLKDGSLQAGIISAENESTLTLKAPGAPAPVVIAKDQIKTRVVSPNSLMPEGLLNGLEEPDVRSLFLYLRQTSEPK